MGGEGGEGVVPGSLTRISILIEVELHWNCPVIVVILVLDCTETALVLHWNGTETVLRLQWD